MARRLVQSPVAGRRAHVLAASFRRKRAHVVLRSRSVPTPTPLVRKRLTQTPVANDRAATIARFFRRKRAHIVLRAPLPFVARRQVQPIVSHADVHASSRIRFLQPRGARIVRAASTPTVTPLVRKRVLVETTLVARSRTVARLRRRKPTILRAALPAPAAFVRPKVTVVTRNRRPAYIRAHVHHPVILRARVTAPVAVVRPSITVVRRRRAVTIRAFYGRQQGARIMRAPVLATPTVRVKVALVVRSRRAPLVARARRNPVVLRGLSTVTPTSLVRKRLILETQTGNRARVVVRVRHHSRAFLVRSFGGSAAAAVTFLTGFFDPSGTRGPGQTTPAVAAFDSETHNADASNPSFNDFDPPNPR